MAHHPSGNRNVLFASLICVVSQATACGLTKPKYIDYKDEEDGAADAEGVEGGDDSSEPVAASYAGNVKSVIDAKCGGPTCHVGGTQIPDLSDFAKAQANGERTVTRATEKTMPPSASTQLTPTEIELLAAWRAQGYPP